MEMMEVAARAPAGARLLERVGTTWSHGTVEPQELSLLSLIRREAGTLQRRS